MPQQTFLGVRRLLGAMVASGALTVCPTAFANCETRDGCGLIRSVGGIDASRSSARTNTQRDGTLYGVAIRQGGTARAPGGHVFDFAATLSIGAHGEGGPPGGSVVLGGAYGRTLALAPGSVHELYVKGRLHQDFHITRALTHYRIELPALELGYGVHDRSITSELGLRAGLELYASDTLRADDDDDTWHRSQLFAPYLGAGARVITRGISFDLAAHRVYPRGEPGARIDRGELALCASAFWIGVCGSGAYLRARDSEAGPEVRALEVGLTVGVGWIGPLRDLD